MKKPTQSGFTLIELLVVIAIIGILASVIIASLSSARGKSADAKIKSQLNSMRAQAMLYSIDGNAFNATMCNVYNFETIPQNTVFQTANNGLGTLFTGLDKSKMICMATAGRPSNGSSWAVAAQTSTGLWCVDATGVSRDKNANGDPYEKNNFSSAIVVTGPSNLRPATCL